MNQASMTVISRLCVRPMLLIVKGVTDNAR